MEKEHEEVGERWTFKRITLSKVAVVDSSKQIKSISSQNTLNKAIINVEQRHGAWRRSRLLQVRQGDPKKTNSCHFLLKELKMSKEGSMK